MTDLPSMTAMRLMSSLWTAGWLGCALLAGCSGTAGQRQSAAGATTGLHASGDEGTSPPPNAAFAQAAEQLVTQELAADPARAVGVGLHAFDGLLPDISPEALTARAQSLAVAEKVFSAFAAFEDGQLSPLQRLEKATILTHVREQRFLLEELRAPWRDPMLAVGPLSLSNYVVRSYAPADERARAVIAIATASPAFLEQTRRNLQNPLPRPWLEAALKQFRGLDEFVRNDVRPAFANEASASRLQELDAALRTMEEALAAHIADLEARLSAATEDFALGPERFVAMQRATNGIDLTLAQLKSVAQTDFERNRQLLREVAHEMGHPEPNQKTLAALLSAKPDPSAVLEAARERVADLRGFLTRAQVVTIPAGQDIMVEETPSFYRIYNAACDSAGPFEDASQPSFYYITPPDPQWPEPAQRAFVMGRATLISTSIHEVWPGHYLQSLHLRGVPSRVLKVFSSYAMTEGWAHYAEEMMAFDVGYQRSDPEVRLGVLADSLLRNVRFLCAIGMHAEAMPLEQCVQLFRDEAFLSEEGARGEALRGTFDPMYLSYTLGKLVLRQLRQDWMSGPGAGKQLKEFHDRLLACGEAPLPAIRRHLLGAEAGPVLFEVP